MKQRLYPQSDWARTGPYVEVEIPENLLPVDMTERKRVVDELRNAGLLTEAQANQLLQPLA